MPPAAKSAVWKNFKRSSDDKTVKCNLCGAELAYNGGTTSMHNHLRLKHPSDTQPETPAKDKQSTVTSFFNSPRKLTSTQSEKITQAIAEMIVTDYIPLSIVEGEGFRSLMQLVAPDYVIPCRKTVRSRILKKYDDGKEILAKELGDVTSVSLTTDTWTSTTTDSYITVTEHHITDDWKMRSNVLLTRAMPVPCQSVIRG
jgi:hypothetical protein